MEIAGPLDHVPHLGQVGGGESRGGGSRVVQPAVLFG